MRNEFITLASCFAFNALLSSSTALANETAHNVDFNDKKLQSCFAKAITKNLPSAKVKHVHAADRLEGYEKFGDMIHGRSRGIFQIDAVKIQNDQDYGGVRINLTTRIDGTMVKPESMIAQDNWLRANERYYYTHSEYKAFLALSEQAVIPDEIKATETLHQNILKDLGTCLP